MASHRVTLNSNYLIASIAVAFVLYRLVQLVISPILLANVFLDHSTAPAVQPQPVAVHADSGVKLGLNTAANLWPTRVRIPAIDIDLPLTGSIEKDGAWDISLTGANFALNTAIPNGKAGNTALFGHDRPGLFHPIHDLKPGDAITVDTSTSSYVYYVTGSHVVSPTDISVMNQTAAPTLTLVTCDGWLSQNRLVVTAVAEPLGPSASQLSNHPDF